VNSERVVPVHPALLDEGFLKFAVSVRNGPLFADVALDRFGSRGEIGTKVLSKWIRSLGITDKRISPCHTTASSEVIASRGKRRKADGEGEGREGGKAGRQEGRQS
jgi:hypothetical protein